ncbi:MAG: restriction endonuclease, partial [Candidatus Paceibacterota bacterium]
CKQSVGSQEMQSFIGAIGDEDKGLYVSTGGYTSHAQKAADKSHRRLTLLDRDDFISLLIENYEDIDPEYKTLIPLKKVYIPKDN